MSDRPPENLGPVTPETGASEVPARSLSEILEELALISNAQQGDASAMRGAVSELSRALARLFEMIRADRASQHTRIAELEEALAKAQAQVRALESGGGESVADAPPSPTDFDALRGAAERLRRRTEQLVQAAGTPAQEAARAEAEGEQEGERDEHTATSTELPVRPIHNEPFGKPGILRIFPGVALPATPNDFDVESDLEFDEEMPRQAVAQHAVPTLTKPYVAEPPAPSGPTESSAPRDRPAAPETSAPEVDSLNEPAADGDGPALPPPTPLRRAEPIAIKPRIERKRRGVLRRRRIDARKLKDVDPPAALRAMVSAIDEIWTAGNALDLVVAFTDGGALRIAGGDRVPLSVTEVEPGTPARTTVTATSDQVVPLFGRLQLTDEQSAPLIHGSRRDADLLVGWIDRAQRLTAEPL